MSYLRLGSILLSGFNRLLWDVGLCSVCSAFLVLFSNVGFILVLFLLSFMLSHHLFHVETAYVNTGR